MIAINAGYKWDFPFTYNGEEYMLRCSHDSYDKLMEYVKRRGRYTHITISEPLKELLSCLVNDVYYLVPIKIAQATESDTLWSVVNDLTRIGLIEGWHCYRIYGGEMYVLLRLCPGISTNVVVAAEDIVYCNDFKCYYTYDMMRFQAELFKKGLKWTKTGFTCDGFNWCRYI